MVRSNRVVAVVHSAGNVHAGSDRKESGYTEHHSLLCMELQINQGVHADP